MKLILKKHCIIGSSSECWSSRSSCSRYSSNMSSKSCRCFSNGYSFFDFDYLSSIDIRRWVGILNRLKLFRLRDF